MRLFLWQNNEYIKQNGVEIMYHLLNVPRITKAGDRYNITIGRKNIRNVATLE